MINYSLSFIAVVRAAGFTQAARKTGISKAKLSRDVKELENYLGIQLLHRTTRSFSLTEQGLQFYESCKNIETIYDSAVENLKHDFKNMHGVLRLTAPIDFGVTFFEPIVREYCETYPLMNVTLSLSNANENINELQYDLAIRIANQLPDSNLRQIPLMQFNRLICASPAYIKKNKAPKSPDDLKNHFCATIVNRHMNTIKPSWSFYQGSKQVNYPLEHYIETDSYALQLQLVTSGLCIGRLPSYSVMAALEKGELIELLTDVKKPVTYVSALYPDSNVVPNKTRAFIDLLKSHLAKIT